MAGRNEAEMRRMVRDIERFFVDGTKEVMHGMARNTSRGRGVAPGAPVDEGEARGSLRFTVGQPSPERPAKRGFYPIIGAAEVEAAFANLKLGQTAFATWIARHAPSLELGRRIDSLGRVNGSLQAPDGYVHLARDQTLVEMDQWRWRPSAGLVA